MVKWIKPNEKSLKQEYKIEIEMKKNNFFSSYQEMKDAYDNSRILMVDKSIDSKISYRSRTTTKSQLLSLIKSYRSYPEFRNEATLDNLYDRIGEGKTMDMPIVLEFKNGSMRIMSGNTRADVAMQLIGKYYAIVLKVNK